MTFCPVCGWQHYNDRCVRCRRILKPPRPAVWVPVSTSEKLLRSLLDARDGDITTLHDPLTRTFVIPEVLVFNVFHRARLDRKERGE
jgi:hypothetical protein